MIGKYGLKKKRLNEHIATIPFDKWNPVGTE